MDLFLNFVIVLAVIVSIMARQKKMMQQRAQADSQAQNARPAAPKITVPQILAGRAPIFSKNLNKIISVYGSGAMLGTDEVSILLRVSDSAAQNYLEQLVAQGRAQTTASASGKIRYRLV